jgi:hypothetical protein
MHLSFSNLQKRGKAFLEIALMLLFLSACSVGPSLQHQTYTYHGPGEWASDYSSGERVPVQWTVQPGPLANDTAPAKVLLRVELIGGPFRDVNGFLAAVRKSRSANNSFPQSAVIVSAVPIQTNNWTKQSYISAITIPLNLKPGYYDLFYTVTTTYPGKPSVVSREDALFRINVPPTSN